MRRALALLALTTAGLAIAECALAPATTAATLRLSWNSCEPQRPDTVFTGPASYRLVISVADMTPGRDADDHIGVEIDLAISPQGGAEFPDAWRFDQAGCQTSARMTAQTTAFSIACPKLQGTEPIPLAYYDYLPQSGTGLLRLANAYGAVSPVAGRRYTAWQVWFDMARAATGPGSPGVACGGVERRIRVHSQRAVLITTRGVYANLQPTPGDRGDLLWGEEPPVPTAPATWGRVKDLYR